MVINKKKRTPSLIYFAIMTADCTLCLTYLILPMWGGGFKHHVTSRKSYRK